MLISSAAFSWNSTGIESEQTYPARVPKIYYLFALSYKYRSGWGLIPQWTRLLWHSTYYTGVFTCVARLDLFSRLCGRLQTVIHRRRPHTLRTTCSFVIYFADVPGIWIFVASHIRLQMMDKFKHAFPVPLKHPAGSDKCTRHLYSTKRYVLCYVIILVLSPCLVHYHTTSYSYTVNSLW